MGLGGYFKRRAARCRSANCLEHEQIANRSSHFVALADTSVDTRHRGGAGDDPAYCKMLAFV
jgi:hypothetical protein